VNSFAYANLNRISHTLRRAMAASLGTQRRTRRRRILHTTALLVWAAAMSPLLFWGLPTNAFDDYLFGAGPVWSGERIAGLIAAAPADANLGADVDRDAVTRGARPDAFIHLTTSESAQAEILLRYRLYTRQPDEMITLRALREMSPRAFDFDPQLYQYGGVYIYSVAAAIAIGGVTGLLTITNDLSAYLDSPEKFASLYVAARFISLIAGAATE
jgi:hypothetical protein